MHPHTWLYEKYRTKQLKNRRYSLRAFARLLDLPAGRLSQLLTQKRLFTEAQGEKIADALAVSADERREFLASIARQRRAFQRRPRDPLAKLPHAEASMTELTRTELELVGNPFHFSILSLVETEGFRADPVWIARRLGASVHRVRKALDNLETCGFITSAAGIELQSANGVRSTTDVPSAVLRQGQAAVLKEAIVALQKTSVTERDITSMTIAIDPERMPEAKALLAEFRRRLTTLMESGRKREVYRLALQLYPVSISLSPVAER